MRRGVTHHAGDGDFVLPPTTPVIFGESTRPRCYTQALWIIVPNVGRALQATLFRAVHEALSMPVGVSN